MAEKTLEERLSELYEKIDHRDQFFDKDLKTLIDGIRDAREHGGSSDYTDLSNKPAINGVQLSGDKTPAQLGLATANQVETLSNKVDKLPTGYYYGKFSSVEDLPEATEKGYAYIASSDPTVFYTYLVSGAGAEWEDSGNKMVNTIDITTPKTEGTELTKGEKYYASANVNDRKAVVVAETGVVRSLGYKVLNPNLSFAEQVIVPNAIYEIKDSFDLNNGSVTIPANCTLKFNGGRIVNGTLVGNNTVVAAERVLIFSSLVLSGTFCCDGCPEWLGSISKCVQTFKTTDLVPNGDYTLDDDVVFKVDSKIVGNGAKISIPNGEKFILGYGSKMSNITFLCAKKKQVILVSTDNMTKTYYETDRTSAPGSNIYVDNILISYNGADSVNEEDCISVVSDGYCSEGNAKSGFFDVKFNQISIFGGWKNGFAFRTGTRSDSTEVNTWLTDCSLTNSFGSQLKNFLLIERHDEYVGTVGTSTPYCFYIENISSQHGANSDSFIVLNNCHDITIRKAIGWDFTSPSILIDRSGVTDVSITDYRDDGSNQDRVGFSGNASNNVYLKPLGQVGVNYLGNITAEDLGYVSGTHTTATASDFRKLAYGYYAYPVGDAALNYLGLTNSIPRSGNSRYSFLNKIKVYGGFVMEYVGLINNRTHAYAFIANTDSDSSAPTWNIQTALKVYASKSDVPLTERGNGNYIVVDNKLCYTTRYENNLKDALGFTFASWYGTSIQRPTMGTNDKGRPFFDTTLGKPIYWTGTAWVDANGETVGLQVNDSTVLIAADGTESTTVNVYYAGSTAPTINILNADDTPCTWLTASPDPFTGNTLTLTPDSTTGANTGSNPRGCKVVITLGDEVKIVNVVQNYSTT